MPADQLSLKGRALRAWDPERGLSLRVLTQVGLEQRERARLGRRDPLFRLAVDQRERRPQRLVPRHQSVQRPPQRGPVELPAQAQPLRDVVRAAHSAELLEEPEPLLRE